MPDHGLRYVGADSLPSRLSEFDLQQNFQLLRADIEAINSQFRGDRRAGVAVLLLFLRVSGRPLDRISALPRMLLRHIGEKLQVDAPSIGTLRSIYKRRPTHYEHQAWVKKYLGLKEVDQAASDLLVVYLTAQAREVVSVDELVTAVESPCAFDLSPSTRTTVISRKSVNQEHDGHEEEQIHRRTNYRVHQAGRGRPTAIRL